MLNPMDMTGRTVLVTGASSGIGREAAVLLSQLGARLILTARNGERLSQTRQQLAGEGHSIHVFDLGENQTNIPDFLRTLADEHGLIDGLVHAAGIHSMRPLKTISMSDIDKIMRINFSSAVQLARGFRQKGVCARPASLVFVSSVMGHVGQAAVSLYAASKGALLALSKSLALELCGEGIRVNCVAPALVKTELTEQLLKACDPEKKAAIERMHPMGFGQPRDVAYAIAFLLAATGAWITGTSLIVDGGYTAH